MAVMITGNLLNGTNVLLKHGPSGKEIVTAPPVDNGGDGSSFSPTDLCAASLAACSTTIMALFAKNHQIPLEGIEFTISKEMRQGPRRIAKLSAHFQIKTSCTDLEWQKFIAAAKACPVRLSLSPDVLIEESFERIL